MGTASSDDSALYLDVRKDEWFAVSLDQAAKGAARDAREKVQLRLNVYVYIYLFIYICIYIYVFLNVYTYKHRHINTQAHMHTHNFSNASPLRNVLEERVGDKKTDSTQMNLIKNKLSEP